MKWTLEEEQRLIDAKNAGTLTKEIDIGGRSEGAIKAKVKKLIEEGRLDNSHEHYRKWSEKDLQRLKFLRGNGIPIAIVAKVLGRTVGSVNKKLYSLNEVKGYRREWSDQELLEMVARYRTADNLNYNRIQGEPSTTVIRERFGSWTDALNAASLEPNIGGLHPSKPTILYLVDFGQYKKVGLTQRSVKERFFGFPKYNILDTVEFECLEPAWTCEREILNNVKLCKIRGNLPNGNYECFVYDCESLDQLVSTVIA